MLHPRKNRVDYGTQLIPPDGYTLARAIGTTYSLELEPLMMLPVALFYAQTLEGRPDEIRNDMLDAITKAAEKITVFYHNGQLKVPSRYHHLMAYWEQGIVPVTMPNSVSSFHPKVWVTRYECNGESAHYRILITSRNLTFANDWDVAFSAEGKVGQTEQPKNRPLIHFLEYLERAGKRQIGGGFMNELSLVRFDLPEKFDSFRFLPIGIPNPVSGRKYQNPLTAGSSQWEDLLIMSPFLDDKTLLKLRKAANRNAFLLSAKQELDSIAEKILDQFEVRQFSKYVEEAERRQDLSEDGDYRTDQHLHAKLFIILQDDQSVWYLGSANCTDPAQERNVEFMVSLSGRANGLKPRDIFNAVTRPDGNDAMVIFTEYNPSARLNMEAQKRLDLEVRKLKYELSKLTLSGSVKQVEGGTAYDLVLDVDANKMTWSDRFTITVRPLPEAQKKGVALIPGKVNRITQYTGYAETQLSPYLVFDISTKETGLISEFLLEMNIELPETRLHRIFSSIINSREKFLKYLTFLLTGEETALMDQKSDTRKSGKQTSVWGTEGLPVFEKLLLSASRSPERLKSVDTLVERLKAETTNDDEPIITPEFESFWAVFRTYLETTKE